MKTKLPLLIILLTMFAGVHRTCAQGTAFTYQGLLDVNGAVASGTYDFRFRLDKDPAGSTIYLTALTNGVSLTNGVFTVTVDFGAGAFNGSNYWLEVDVRTNNSVSYTPLNPFQPMTAAPYAVFANTASNVSGTVSAAQFTGALASPNLSGLYGNALTFTNAGNSFSGSGANLTSLNANNLASGTVPLARLSGITSNQLDAATWQLATNLNGGNAALASNVVSGVRITNAFITNAIVAGNGTNLTNVNALTLGGLTSAAFWNTAGNTGANPANGAFLGNIDNLPLEIRANNLRSLRIEPGGASTNVMLPSILGGGPDTHSTGAPNMIGGADMNFATGSVGATIAGGGAPYYGVNNGFQVITYINSVTGDFGTVSGGAQNTSGLEGVVGGGFQNTAGPNAVVAGGAQNNAASYSFIGGGNANFAVGGWNVIAGGGSSSANGNFDVIGGGSFNTSAGYNSVIGGGYYNSTTIDEATVGGGESNTVSGIYATIGGGFNNTAALDDAVVGGGRGNIASNLNATIGGGFGNYASGQASVIGGGTDNTNSGLHAVIAGGLDNFAGGTSSTVSGQNNSVKGNFSVISGGEFNTNSAQYSMIPGGLRNITSAQYTFAAGYFAEAVNQGAFVWADSEGTPFGSTANDQFLLRAQGGIGIDTASTPDSYFCVNTNSYLFSNVIYLRGETGSDHNHGLAYNGNTVTNFGTGQYQVDGPALWGFAGGVLGTRNGGTDSAALIWSTTNVSVYGTFNNNSDRNAKQDFATVTPAAILEKVAQLPLSEWSYKTDASTRHIGPMAQDFYSAFNIGTDDKHIAPIDEGGVALAAIQGLNDRLNQKDARIQEQADEIAKLKESVAELKQLMQSLADRK